MSDKGEQLYAEADKKITKFNWFGINREKNNEDAAEIFVKAAAQFKIAKEFGRAGESYEKAANCMIAAKNTIEANSYWREAGKAWSQVDSNKAIECYKKAVDLYLSEDNFTQAAKLMEEIGEILAAEVQEEKLDQAIEAFETAVDYYKANNDETSANKRLLKVALLSAKNGDYNKAIPIFESNAKFSAENNLLRWTVKNYLFQAMLCQLCKACSNNIKDWSVVYKAFSSYTDISDIFTQSREAKLIEKLIPCIEKLDLNGFKNNIHEFHNISPLDAWAVNLLLQCENYIRNKQHASPDALLLGDEDAPNMNSSDDNNNKNNNNNNNNNNNQLPDPMTQNDPFGTTLNQEDLDNAPTLS